MAGILVASFSDLYSDTFTSDPELYYALMGGSVVLFYFASRLLKSNLSTFELMIELEVDEMTVQTDTGIDKFNKAKTLRSLHDFDQLAIKGSGYEFRKKTLKAKYGDLQAGEEQISTQKEISWEDL